MRALVDTAMREARRSMSPLSTLSGPRGSPVNSDSAHSGSPDAAFEEPDDRTVAEDLTREERPESDRSAEHAEVIETAFAGVFVLWRSVIEMDLLSLLPGGKDEGPARLARASSTRVGKREPKQVP